VRIRPQRDPFERIALAIVCVDGAGAARTSSETVVSASRRRIEKSVKAIVSVQFGLSSVFTISPAFRIFPVEVLLVEPLA